jgi:hypothetical protein
LHIDCIYRLPCQQEALYHEQHQLWLAKQQHATIQQQYAEAQQHYADEFQEHEQHLQTQEQQWDDDWWQQQADWKKQQWADDWQQQADWKKQPEQAEQAEQASEAEWVGMQMGAAERAADIEAERVSAQQHGSLSQHSKKNRQGHVFRGCFSIAVVLHMSLGDVFRRCKDLDYIFYII